jgi:PKD repeat protein
LTVTFVTKAEASGVQIFRYRWDFEGDGVFDTDDPGERDYTRTFTTPGIRNALLQVTNDKNQTATAAVQINVTGAPPIASAAVTPSNGAVPLNVTLTGTATRGTAPIAKYEWDFQGDGIYDFSSTSTGNTTFRYATAGTYNAAFRVTDTAGLQSIARATATAIRVGPPGSPTANITVPSSPVRQNAPAVISFAGTGTTPAGTITKYEWDFEGDGTYDFSSPSNASTTHIYNAPGVYTASLRVTNSTGLTGIDTVDISVDILVTLQLSTDTLRPPGTVVVNTFLGGTAPVTIFIRNKSGQTVRTLVNNVTRTLGNYSDSWDGKGDNGAFVAEGAYYVVLKFLANGNPFFVDLTNTTGNQFYNPVWSLATTKGGSCFDCPFAPYENNFLQATFTLTEASEVSVSIRGYDTVNEVARLIDQRPFGRGKQYVVVWEGTNANGKLVDPSLYNDSQFIFGLTATTLPDNAIVVELAPEITQVSVTPNYYDPYTTDFLTSQKPTATVSYTLSKQSTVRLQVYRTGTNVLLRTIERPSAPAGAGTITWDGRDDKGIFADKGEYRLSVKAIDTAGNQSLVRYALMKVFY